MFFSGFEEIHLANTFINAKRRRRSRKKTGAPFGAPACVYYYAVFATFLPTLPISSVYSATYF